MISVKKKKKAKTLYSISHHVLRTEKCRLRDQKLSYETTWASKRASGGTAHTSSEQPCNSMTRIITTELKNSYIHLWVPYAVFLPSGPVLVPVPLGTLPRGCGRADLEIVATEDFASINNFIACRTFFHVSSYLNSKPEDWCVDPSVEKPGSQSTLSARARLYDPAERSGPKRKSW